MLHLKSSKEQKASLCCTDMARRSRNLRFHVLILGAQSYLWGTFVLFLLGPHAIDARGLGWLCAFVAAAHLALFLGYQYGLSNLNICPGSPLPSPPSGGSIRKLVVISAIYHILFGAALLWEYGCTSPKELLHAILSPGEAYFAKFSVYEDQLTRIDHPNSLLQLLTLTHVLSYFLIPCMVVYWERLTFFIKGLGITGLAVYASFFAFIGTQKGLGDIVVLGLSGYLVRRYGILRTRAPRWVPSRRMTVVVVLSVAAFLVYMSQNQLDRLRQWDGESRARYEAERSLFCAVLGQELGFRVSLVTSYPTHGYCGLSHSLQMPFVWTEGLGSSRALASYLSQYFAIPEPFERTYLARAEAETGWPALMNWSTIYPWLASDFTFPGTLVLMFLLGWLASRAWYDALHGDLLSLIVVTQIIICILYVPANNQLLQSRTGLWGTIALAAIYIVSRFNRRPAPIGLRISPKGLGICGKC
jgi:hypothetical protein